MFLGFSASLPSGFLLCALCSPQKRLCRLELQQFELLRCNTVAQVQHLHADDTSFAVEIEYDSRRDLLGLDYRSFVQSEVERIAVFVNLEFHSTT